MDVNERAPPLRPSTETVNIVTEDKNLKLRGHKEKEKFKDLKDREFGLTPAYDPQLLQDTDTTLEGPAYTSYADRGQAESSRHAQEVHNPWEQPQP
jgi:hypothetical protein